jgi:putative membrane protein
MLQKTLERQHVKGVSRRLTGAAVGAAGGLLGAWVMVRLNHVMGHLIGGAEADERTHGRRRAMPNDTDGTISDEPATMKAASWVSMAVTGQSLTHRGKRIGGPIVHYAFGAAMGTFYGAVAEVQPGVTAGGGLPFGAAVWLIADEVGLPVTGLSNAPACYPLARHAAALTTHLGFGAAVEGVRRLLLGRIFLHERED